MNRLYTCVLVCLLIGFSGVSHGQYDVNFTTMFGSTDTGDWSEFTVSDGTSGAQLIAITGRSSVDSGSPTDPDATAGVDPANVNWDGDADVYTGGLGIQPGTGTGSRGINGSGTYQDEEITIAYSNGGVSLDTITLTLNGLDGATDDPIIWINTTAGRFVVDETAILGAATPNGGTGTAANSQKIDFSNFAGIVGGANETVTSIVLRERTGEIWIKETEFGVAVPEPSSVLFGFFSTGLFLIRRRR